MGWDGRGRAPGASRCQVGERTAHIGPEDRAAVHAEGTARPGSRGRNLSHSVDGTPAAGCHRPCGTGCPASNPGIGIGPTILLRTGFSHAPTARPERDKASGATDTARPRRYGRGRLASWRNRRGSDVDLSVPDRRSRPTDANGLGFAVKQDISPPRLPGRRGQGDCAPGARSEGGRLGHGAMPALLSQRPIALPLGPRTSTVTFTLGQPVALRTDEVTVGTIMTEIPALDRNPRTGPSTTSNG